MKNATRRYLKMLLQLWMLSTAVFFITEANALILGEIQVDSKLGQPLSARIFLIDLTAADVLQFKARLANAEDYSKLGLRFPRGYKFNFRLVNDSGKRPYIVVTTEGSLSEPVNDLMIDVSSAAGKLVKSYTFLLDPA